MNNKQILKMAPSGMNFVYDKSNVTKESLETINDLIRLVQPRSLDDIKRIVELEKNNKNFAKKVLMQVGTEINEETRMTKNAKSFAVAIILNKISELGGVNLLEQDNE